jgi:hypothetical protein
VRAINRGGIGPKTVSVDNATLEEGAKTMLAVTELRTSDDEAHTVGEEVAQQTIGEVEVEESTKYGENESTVVNTCVVLHDNDLDTSLALADHKILLEESEVRSINKEQTAAEISIEDISNEPEVVTGTETMCHGKGNKLFRGVISKVKLIHLYEISYPDGTKDVNIPIEALRLSDGISHNDIKIGTGVDVLSWQDRWGYKE